MTNPKVSIIIPVYNVEKYLRQCLDSVINQTLKEIEIICVDDGSTDSSLDILREYEEKDSRVKVLQQQNQFAGVARNNGLAIASGEYVTFMDSDDFYEIDGLERLYKIVIENDLDFVKCASYSYNESTQEYEERDWYLNKKAENLFNMPVKFAEYPDILYGICDVPWNALYKMSFLKEFNIFFPNFRCVNDHSFFINCLFKAERFMITDVYLVHHRIERNGSLINKKHYYFEDQIRNYLRVKELVLETNNDAWKKLALRRELSALTYWYKELMSRNINTFNLQNIMITFVNNFDVDDVGEEFLKSYTYAKIFDELKNKTPIKVCKEEIKNPQISVIVPVYNTLQYLPKCIGSLLKQTLKEFEIIFVDDGSTDGSYELLLEYADLVDKRIKVVRNEKKGVMYARYKGCCMAKAPYIQFLDSDDWLAENALEKLYKSSIDYNYDVCSFQYYNFDETEQKINSIASDIEHKFLPNKYCFSYRDCQETIFQLNSTKLCSKCYRKDFIKNFLNITFDLHGTEDLPVSCYSILFAEKIIYLPEPLYYYRRNRVNSLETTKDVYPLNFYRGYKRFFDLVKTVPFFEDIEISYVNRVLRGCIYALLSKKSEKGYTRTYKFLQKKGFRNLRILGYTEHCYYNQMDYNMLYYMTKFKFIIKKDDLLLLANKQTSDAIRRGILQKYEFNEKLKKLRCQNNWEVVIDQRSADSNPDISIIVPVYNTAVYLRSCLDSLKEQSFKNIEVICINDGSTDDSLHILQRYAVLDNRFVVISQENSGQSVARNLGVKFSRGKYLCFCDSDVLLQKGALEKLYIEFSEKKLDMIFFNTELQFQDKHSFFMKYLERTHSYNGVFNGKDLMAKMLENNEYLQLPVLSMINRRFFYNNNLFFSQGIVHEDDSYNFKAMYCAKRVGYMSDKLYVYRVCNGSTVTRKKEFAHTYGYFYCLLEILDFIKERNMFKEDLETTIRILNGIRYNANKIFNSLSKEEKETVQLLSGYEQIQFTNFIVNYQPQQSAPAKQQQFASSKSQANTRDEASVELAKVKKELQNVKSGWSFRIGRVITYVPRKVRGGIKCYKEHGLGYTINRCIEKISGKD